MEQAIKISSLPVVLEAPWRFREGMKDAWGERLCVLCMCYRPEPHVECLWLRRGSAGLVLTSKEAN